MRIVRPLDSLPARVSIPTGLNMSGNVIIVTHRHKQLIRTQVVIHGFVLTLPSANRLGRVLEKHL